MIVTTESAAAYVRRLKTARDPSEHTLRAYACDLNDYARFLAARRLCAAEGGTLLAYAGHLRDERAVAPRTLRRRMACLRGFYKEMVRGGVLERSPFADLEMQLPRPRALPRALTRYEARQLATAARCALSPSRRPVSAPAFPLAVLLLLATGLRVGELVGLRGGDFDPDSGSLLVRGKGRRERKVFVVDADLRRLLAIRAASAGVACLWSGGHGWTTQGVRRRLADFAVAAGIARRITPHMLRHTCATLLLEDGVDLRVLQRLLGHENIATTAIYAHVGDTALRAALERAGLLASLAA
jgi:site-specific recombinase XerD